MNKPLKRTKIIATLGPATDDLAVLTRMLDQGVDLVRLNFSHDSAQKHQDRVQKVRAYAMERNREIGILADLQGPKIRIACFKQKKIILQKGATFILDADLPSDAGDETTVGIDYKELPRDVKSGDILLLDDGRLIFEVIEVPNPKIICKVLIGGELSNHKGINRQGGGLSATFLTEKDKQDLKDALAMGVDYLAFSFPRSAQDILEARELIKQANGKAGVIAKIERSEAVADIDAIILASDGIMVARGDLGVEIGDAELPSVQKMIISKCRYLDRTVITATQMMESMIHNTIPTRAEVFDVANAVLDGTDAMMLSAETATGAHPDIVIEAAVRICLGAERNSIAQTSTHRLEREFKRVDEAIATAVMYTAKHMNIRAILCLTESGSTPLWMSRIRSGIPIYAISRLISTLRKVTLFRGVYPIFLDVTLSSGQTVNQASVEHLKQKELICDGDLVILTKGDFLGVHGGTNTMKIIKVGESY